ncbi:MAG TPA: flagellar biosynthesis protein FlhB [Anaerolineales bacterium]|nr:flagellar biosynthesis protein FlhB [Anaerolineales bacterium]
MSQERTEAPSGKRLAEARRKGQVPRSIELQSAAVLLAAATILSTAGSSYAAHTGEVLRETLASFGELASVDASVAGDLLWAAMGRQIPSLGDLGLIVLGIAVVAVAAALGQTGLVWASQRPWFDASRLDPLQGLKRLVNVSGLVNLLKAALKLVLIGWVAYAFLMGEAAQLPALAAMSLNDAVELWVDLALGLFWRVASAYVVVAVADYAYQRWEWWKSLKMTKQEVKEEYKQNEGNPQIKNYIRQQQRKMARQRMMAAVPKADVVITNPTHYAIALKYQREEMDAPTVVAKGVSAVALRIRAVAGEHSVPIVENPPLARALYRLVEIDDPVPPQLYLAVAEVLAYVYGLKRPKGASVPA